MRCVCVCNAGNTPCCENKDHSGKTVFRCFRTSRGEKSLPIRSRQRLCVCAVFAFPRGFGPRSRRKAAVGAGRSASAVAPANAGAFRRGARGESRLCPAATGPSVTNTAAGTARASGPEALGDCLGQERGGVHRARSCGGNPRGPVQGAEQGQCGQEQQGAP